MGEEPRERSSRVIVRSRHRDRGAGFKTRGGGQLVSTLCPCSQTTANQYAVADGAHAKPSNPEQLIA